MSERMRSASTTGYNCPKMETDLSPRKTMLVVVIVVGCFAVLWPKVFYPMIVGNVSQHIKPSPIDKTTGCCDVISDRDVSTIKIMSELCGNIIKQNEGAPLTGKEIVQKCRNEVLEACGIDISLVLQEQVRLGQSVKQILDEIRSLNGSLCLKYTFGVAPWSLGVPHRIMVKAAETPNIRQERSHHLRSELVHPAFRERGRAIPQPQPASAPRSSPKVVEGRPGPIPGMRPTLGGAGHVVPPSKQSTSSMSVIMPIYTIGIVIFFTYTLMKIIFKKQPEGVGGSLYPPVDPDQHFRKEVFESESSRLGSRFTREQISSKLVVNAMSALLDEVDQEIEARRKSSEVASQDLANGTLSNGGVVKSQEEEQPTVKVLGLEVTASCEGGKKWSRSESPVVPSPTPPPLVLSAASPQAIYLEGALPAQSQLLVSDSAIEPEPTTGEDPAVVLSGKMTLSVISFDSENGVDPIPVAVEQTTIEPAEKSEDSLDVQNMTEQINEEISNSQELILDKDIQEFLTKIKEQNDSIQVPIDMLESDVTSTNLEVENLGQEVDDLIQTAIQNIENREPISIEETNKNRDDYKLEDLKNKLTDSELFNNSFEDNVNGTQEMTHEKDDEEKISVDSSLQSIATVKFNNTDADIEAAVLPSNETRKSVEENLITYFDNSLVTDVSGEETQIGELQSVEGKASVNGPSSASEVEIFEHPEVIEKTDVISSEKLEINQPAVNNFIKEFDSSVASMDQSIESSESKNVITPFVSQVQDNFSLPTDSSENIEKNLILTEKQGDQPAELDTNGSISSHALAERSKPTTEIQQLQNPPQVESLKQKTLPVEAPITDESDELLSDEEVEEIEYEEETEEEIEEEIEEEEEIEDVPLNDESGSIQRVNGDRSEDVAEASKYTTASGPTVAENDISEELTDEEEVIEVEEVEDDDYIIEEDNDLNHVSDDSEEPEL